ncbi:MAG: putative esterase [Patiriisocius sp.]|jgi:predicted esterase
MFTFVKLQKELKMAQEKQVSYTTKNTYCTLNDLTENTKNIWIVFHGLGFLSRYFLRYFEGLNPDENFIIAPQAPSKHYLGTSFKHVGACWLTKENTKLETENALNYIDKVVDVEIIKEDCTIIILGYSQGVSIATRWMASRKIACSKLILHSGGIPIELNPKSFDYLDADTKVIYLYGNKDKYINAAKKTEETLKASKLFHNRLEINVFDGVHEIHTPSILRFAE